MIGRDAKAGGGASTALSAVIAATTRWLMRAYPPQGGALGQALAQTQVRQAATVAAWLRYPTELDAELLTLLGPGGPARLDWAVGADAAGGGEASWLASQVPLDAWLSWVDDVVASWAACLLADPALAAEAVDAVRGCPHLPGPACEFRRLTEPDDRDRQAAVLVRHPDLLAPVADLHRGGLLASLAADVRD